MNIQDIRVQKRKTNLLELVIFQKLPQDPTPIQILRHRRKERMSYICAVILTIVMLVGIGAQIGKFVDIAMAKKSIKALQADNRLLDVSIGNLEVELTMKTQDNVICHLASRELGMIQVDKTQVMVLPVGNTHVGDTQLVSTGYQQ